MAPQRRAIAVSLALFLAAGFCAANEEAPLAPEPEIAKRPIRQVQIQAWISEATEQGLRDIGANLRFTRFVRDDEQSGSVQQIDTQVFDPEDPLFTATLPAPDQSLFGPPLRPDASGTLGDGIQTQSGVGFTFSIIDAGRGTIEGVFRGIEQETDIDLISKPELIVIDGGTAEIHAGGKVPFQDIKYSSKGEPQLNVQWRDIGVNMKMTPTILSENLIQLNIENLQVSDIARIDNIRGVDLPVFSQRFQSGKVLVPDGQTLVIGGLSNRVVRRSERRVPLLGAIPVLGIPFRSREHEVLTTHLLIFVSPTIVDLRKMTSQAQSALDFWRERRWRYRPEIEEEVRMLQEEP